MPHFKLLFNILWLHLTRLATQAHQIGNFSPEIDIRQFFIREFGRWKPLEAGLAAMGSQAEAVLDCVEDEDDSGRGKPIDVEYLLANVVPSILTLSGVKGL